MSDSSEEEVNVEIPYSSRPEWSDVHPIDQVRIFGFVDFYFLISSSFFVFFLFSLKLTTNFTLG
jgi:hypothetical protein